MGDRVDEGVNIGLLSIELAAAFLLVEENDRSLGKALGQGRLDGCLSVGLTS